MTGAHGNNEQHTYIQHQRSRTKNARRMAGKPQANLPSRPQGGSQRQIYFSFHAHILGHRDKGFVRLWGRDGPYGLEKLVTRRHSAKIWAASTFLTVSFAHRRRVQSAMNTLKDMYVLADHCPNCGVAPLYHGHTCGPDWVEECCPACGKLLATYRVGEKVQGETRCECDEMCMFCPQCCSLLRVEVSARVQ